MAFHMEGLRPVQYPSMPEMHRVSTPMGPLVDDSGDDVEFPYPYPGPHLQTISEQAAAVHRVSDTNATPFVTENDWVMPAGHVKV